MPTAELQQTEWLDATAAARLAGTTRQNIAKLAREGWITTREIPGVRNRYLRASVEVFFNAVVRPAKGA